MDNYGILSLIPPILAIALALITKNILISLFASIFLGITIIAGWNPFVGFYMLIKDYFFEQIADSFNAQAMFLMIIIGGFVALLTSSGGALAFSNKVTKRLDTRAKCETASWITGILIWFTDTGNSLLIGPIFGEVGDRLKVSREKFAYILDCTTSPICALIPFIGWGVYNMGLIQSQLDVYSITNITSWDLFVKAIPFNFYAILTLLMCGYVSMTQFDFGPMLQAQKRAELTGHVIREGGVPLRKTKEIKLPEGIEPKMSTMVLPLIVMLGCMFTILILNGFPFKTVPGSIIRTSISYGFLSATFLLIFLCVRYKIMNFNECLDKMVEGMSGMIYMVVVLVLAWSLGSICGNMGTANYLIEMTKGLINPAVLPFIIFIIGAAMSLATGTSWGTYAILFPIGLPMAITMGSPLEVVIAAIISGGLFGDHVSPISDTTILASMGAASDHIDHFKTQMPYGVTVAVISSLMFLIAGFKNIPIILVLGIVVMAIVVYVLHKLSLNKIDKEMKGGSGKLNVTKTA